MEPSDTSARRLADIVRRDRFLTLALAFEGSLSIVALGLGWLKGIHPLARFSLDPLAALFGAGLAVALFGVFVILFRFPVGPLRQIRKALVETLGPELVLCRWWELLGLAFVTGFSEELLFRGVFQPWLGLIWSNVVFGLVHWISPLYALLAGGIGLILGSSMEPDVTKDLIAPNLITPIVTHTLYDFLAFLVVVRQVRADAART